MRLALAQLNPIVADLTGNVGLITRAVAAAAADRDDARAGLVVVPELAICGYPPKDLLLRSGFVDQCDRAVDELARTLVDGPAVLVGHPTRRGCPDGAIGNAASLLAGGEVRETILKQLLPNYDVFDEARYFLPGPAAVPIPLGDEVLGVHVCEDAWFGVPNTFYHLDPDRPDPVDSLVRQGATLLVNLSASPFELDKPDRRLELMRTHVARAGRPYVFVNQVGGNDDLVFDGQSFVLNADGSLAARLAAFESDLRVVDTADLPQPVQDPPDRREARLLDALTLGVRDYMTKCGFTDAVLGLSGGIDSAVAAAIACRAIGPENVHGLLMPSRYSSDHSVADAQALADNLGMPAETVPIDTVHKAYEQTPVIGDDLTLDPAGLADQNLQARIRGASVMVRSNHHGWIALATGNKSEIAVGYCTLYGDMAGGFAVLCDVFKEDVYAVARYINELAAAEGTGGIPVSTVEKPPSAELAPDQQDSDSLPPYPVLDAILRGLVEEELSFDELTDRFDRDTVAWVLRALDRNEFKRRQMAPGIKLSARAFGSGRRMPMAARFDPNTFPEMREGEARLSDAPEQQTP